jgi:hypothetical protein
VIKRERNKAIKQESEIPEKREVGEREEGERE